MLKKTFYDMPLVNFDQVLNRVINKALDDLILIYKGKTINFSIFNKEHEIIEETIAREAIQSLLNGKAQINAIRPQEHSFPRLDVEITTLDDFTMQDFESFIVELGKGRLKLFYEQRETFSQWDELIDSYWSFFEGLDIPIDAKLTLLRETRRLGDSI